VCVYVFVPFHVFFFSPHAPSKPKSAQTNLCVRVCVNHEPDRVFVRARVCMYVCPCVCMLVSAPHPPSTPTSARVNRCVSECVCA